MDAEFQRFTIWFIQALGGGFCMILWMNFRDLKAVAEATKSELSDYKLHVAENFVTQNDLGRSLDTLTKAIDAVFRKLDKIDEKLDSKQDKSA
jgi:hypothetical protein